MKAHKKETAQIVIFFVILIPVIIAALTISYDFGRLFVLKNQVRIIADSAALAGAGSLDMRSLNNNAFVLNPDWAQSRAQAAYNTNVYNMDPEDSWMRISLATVSVVGNSVTVVVTGTCDYVWGSYFGLTNCAAVFVSTASPSSGISSGN